MTEIAPGNGQRSLAWYRARLGKISGSNVGLLMKAGRGGEPFADTAKAYIFQLAAERAMNPAVVADDGAFAGYLEQTAAESKAMRFGTEQEAYARRLYERITGRRVVEVGSCRHPSIPNFASSPDGFCYDEDTGERGCIEIKCPAQHTFMKYRSEVDGNGSLLRAKPEYFYQCMAHAMCCGAGWVDFVAYNPFQADPLHVVRILPDGEAFRRMEERIRMADGIIERITEGDDDPWNSARPTR